MKSLFQTLKKNIVLYNTKYIKLYFSLLFLLNAIYLFLEVHKSNISHNPLLKGEIQPEEFMNIFGLSKVDNTIEAIIICIYLIGLIFSKRYSISIKQFMSSNFIFITLIFFVNSLVSVVFSAPIGNLNQQFFLIYGITIIISVYFILEVIYRKGKLIIFSK